MNKTYFCLSEQGVSVEDFNNEILAIDLKSGCYHSLRNSGVQVWRLLMGGHSVEDSLPCLAAFYGMDTAALEHDVKTFISQLEAQQLIAVNPHPSEVSAAPILESNGEAYAKPLMETYSDLQDLLLLDPIHEVDVAGWPNKRVDPD